MTRLSIGCVALLLGSCATAPPPLTSASPASPEASEGAHTPRLAALRADDVSRKTAALLSAAQKEQQHWDAYGPVSGNPEEVPKDKAKPETKNEQH